MRPKSWRHGHVPGQGDMSWLLRMQMRPWWAGLVPRAGKRDRAAIEPNAQDLRNVRQLAFGLERHGHQPVDPQWLAAILRSYRIAQGGTAGSWRKRLRRLALLGWAKENGRGAWSLTAEGRKAAA